MALTSTMLFVTTIDKNKLGDHEVTMTNTLVYGGETWTPSITFTISVVDPCDSTEWVDFSISTLTTDNGVVGTVDFADVEDSVEVAKGINTLCGPREYSIAYQDSTSIDWVTVAEHETDANYYTITADPTLDEHEGTHDLALTMSLTNYPSHAAHVVNF